MIALLVSLAVASPVDCVRLVGNTVAAARYVADGAQGSGPVLAAFAEEQRHLCETDRTPSAEVVACIVGQTAPDEVLACDEELYDDLVGLVFRDTTVAVASNP